MCVGLSTFGASVDGEILSATQLRK